MVGVEFTSDAFMKADRIQVERRCHPETLLLFILAKTLPSPDASMNASLQWQGMTRTPGTPLNNLVSLGAQLSGLCYVYLIVIL